MKHKEVKKRNPYLVMALLRKAGSHRKTNKALRKAQNQRPVEVTDVQ